MKEDVQLLEEVVVGRREIWRVKEADFRSPTFSTSTEAEGCHGKDLILFYWILFLVYFDFDFSALIVSPAFKKLKWMTLAADDETVTITFSWCAILASRSVVEVVRGPGTELNPSSSSAVPPPGQREHSCTIFFSKRLRTLSTPPVTSLWIKQQG